jgi:ribosomal protein L37AE/L43A
MVEGRIKPPAVDISNEKIIARHISSIVLAEFFKGNKSFYGNVKNFFRFESPQDSGTNAVKNFLYNKPSSVLISLKRILPKNMQEVFDIDNWKWIEGLIGEEGRLTLADKVIRDEHAKLTQYYKTKEEEWKNTKDQQKRSKINRDMEWASKRLSEIERRPLIDFLASHIVIPKYGFPVDVVALDIIYKKVERAKEIELERDLRMAIAEFAPTSQVVANGYIWKSYGLKSVREKTWPLYWYAICPMCKRFLIKHATIDESRPVMECPIHGAVENHIIHKFVIPIFGFVTSRDADPLSPGESRPPHEFTTRPYFFGGYKMPEEKQIELAKFKIKCKYSKDGELAVVCRGKGAGFWICFECGAAFSKPQKNHKTPFGQECNKALIGPLHLGHTFKTDVLSVSFKQPEMPMSDTSFWYSLLYAILEGTSQALGIKRQDLDGCLFPSEEGISLILFDNVPGGAGHVKRLMDNDNFREALESALNRVKNCSCGLETSCYGCLRNYQNQFCHDQLNRGKVLEFLENSFK